MSGKQTPWYACGLQFECAQCGRCCSGPEEGYIWVNARETRLIADYLKITARDLRKKYLRRVGFRPTIIENTQTRDCIFLENHNGRKKCRIYPVRPNQCRIWPFWPRNLLSPDAWNNAAVRCPGINHGRLYRYEEIEAVRSRRNWWEYDEKQLLEHVEAIYNWIDERNATHQPACRQCGRCCDFAHFGHLLFVSTPELIYLAAKIGKNNIRTAPDKICPYNENARCTIHNYRFAGCRIFFCTGDSILQGELSEQTIRRFRRLCTDLGIQYHYAELTSALNNFQPL